MTIEFSHDVAALKPLKKTKTVLAPAECVLAVDTVLLAAGEIPPGILRRFYETVLGLTPLPVTDADQFRFKHGRRELLLARSHKTLGTVKLTIRNVSEVLPRLRDGHVHYELLHRCDGLVAAILLRDPAGNLVELQQTRTF